MTGRNANIYFPEETYNKLREVAGVKISRFVSEAVEEKLQKEQQQKKEELRQQLITGYQKRSKNENLQKMLRVYGEMSWENINTELTRRERKNDKRNK